MSGDPLKGTRGVCVTVNESVETLKIERVCEGGGESEMPIKVLRSTDLLHYITPSLKRTHMSGRKFRGDDELFVPVSIVRP